MLAEITWESVLFGYGPLGLFAVFVVYCLREWWTTRRPHYVAKLQAETDRELAQTELFQALSTSHPLMMEILRHQTALAERIVFNQADHAGDCKKTHELIVEIHKRVHQEE